MGTSESIHSMLTPNGERRQKLFQPVVCEMCMHLTQCYCICEWKMVLLARITAVTLLRNLPVLRRSPPVDRSGTYIGILKKGPKTRKVYLSFSSPAAGLKPHKAQTTVDVQKLCLLCFALTTLLQDCSKCRPGWRVVWFLPGLRVSWLTLVRYSRT